MNRELPDVQAGFRKGRGTGDRIANIHWIIKKVRVSEEHLLLLYRLCQAFDCVHHRTLWKILKEMGIPDHLTCLCMPVRKQQLELEMEQQIGPKSGKGVHQGCILSPCLFNLHEEYIMRNAGLDEAKAVIKISGRNINNLR